MQGRELIQLILENSLSDEEIQVVNHNYGDGEPDSPQHFDITAVNASQNDDGDTVGVLVIVEQ